MHYIPNPLMLFDWFVCVRNSNKYKGKVCHFCAISGTKPFCFVLKNLLTNSGIHLYAVFHWKSLFTVALKSCVICGMDTWKKQCSLESSQMWYEISWCAKIDYKLHVVTLMSVTMVYFQKHTLFSVVKNVQFNPKLQPNSNMPVGSSHAFIASSAGIPLPVRVRKVRQLLWWEENVDTCLNCHLCSIWQSVHLLVSLKNHQSTWERSELSPKAYLSLFLGSVLHVFNDHLAAECVGMSEIHRTLMQPTRVSADRNDAQPLDTVSPNQIFFPSRVAEVCHL